MTNRSDKRARKKSHRDAVVAQQWAAYRRRRFVRWTAGAIVFALLAALVVVAIGSGNKDEKEDKQKQQPAAQNTPPEPPSEQTPAPLPKGVACGAEAPPPASPQQYQQPEQVTEQGVDYGAVITTSCGQITVDLQEEDAPETVNNFVFLAQEGYYNGLIFHRVEPGFVIQSGDPNGLNGTEPDGPGYSIPDELPTGSKDYTFGTLAMANAGPGTGGSQFFLVTSDKAAGLQPDYSIFGMASEDSKDALLEIDKQERFGGTDPARASMPKKSVYIESIEITEN